MPASQKYWQPPTPNTGISREKTESKPALKWEISPLKNWRIEIQKRVLKSGKIRFYWNWRKGSGHERKYKYGGVATHSLDNSLIRKRFRRYKRNAKKKAASQYQPQ